jgi:VanZ family protein
MIKKISSWILVFLWSALIFYLSNIPYLRIEQLGFLDFVLRKIAHITEYTVLFILYIRAFKDTTKLADTKVYLLSIVFSIIYAITDEIHQSFVPGRSCNFFDLLFYTTGVVLGSVIYKNYKRY